jgi:hypothetical protein
MSAAFVGIPDRRSGAGAEVSWWQRLRRNALMSTLVTNEFFA